jgi:hypothetical protein
MRATIPQSHYRPTVHVASIGDQLSAIAAEHLTDAALFLVFVFVWAGVFAALLTR